MEPKTRTLAFIKIDCDFRMHPHLSSSEKTGFTRLELAKLWQKEPKEEPIESEQSTAISS
jgi:hypothetical protein